MSVEQITFSKEFEQILPTERERKFLPIFPEQLERFRQESTPIEQFYLSHTDEPFSLRMRETFRNGELYYEATLKDMGRVENGSLSRIEITTPITSELYREYKSDDTPVIRKLRAEPVQGVVIDFYEDGSAQVESESDEAWKHFTSTCGSSFAEITGDVTSQNEWRAHLSFRRTHNGNKALVPGVELHASDVARDIISHLPAQSPVVVHIGGRSGSGKSTIVREIVSLLDAQGITSDVLSTDDYHRGASWLEQHNGGRPWEHWDDPIVYDTNAMAQDLAHLRSGTSIYRRSIDWTTVEPTYESVITPCSVLIIEGIYATTTAITPPQDLTYRMTTPLATCIGRRLLRDMRERPQFANPVTSLSYMLTDAEPAYREQHKGDFS